MTTEVRDVCMYVCMCACVCVCVFRFFCVVSVCVFYVYAYMYVLRYGDESRFTCESRLIHI